MRSPTTILHSVAIMALAALPLATPGTAQVHHDGLTHHALGSATIQVVTDPAGRKLVANNIGSSGQDGVAIDLPGGVRGHTLHWDSPPDLDPGASHTLEMRGVSGGIGAVVSAGSLRSERNSDGSITLTPDFSGVGATGVWIVCTDATGAVVKRKYESPPVPVHVTAIGVNPLYEDEMSGIQHNPLYASLNVRQPFTVRGTFSDGTTADFTAIRFIRDSGDPITELTSLRLTCSVPSGTGSVAIAEEGIVPPCAGCPNGPDDSGNLVALGEARYGSGGGGGGGAGGELVLENLGSSGQDGVSVIGERTCCRVDELGVSISDAAQSSPAPGVVLFESHGSLGGIPDQPLGTLACTFESDEWAYVPDFSAIGATGYRVLLYRNGAQIADVPNPPDGARRWGDGHVTLMKITDDGSEEYRIICITHPCPGSPVTVGGVEYLADEIRMRPLGSGGGGPLPVPDNIASMSFRSTGATTITISGTSFRSSAPIVGVEPQSSAIELAAARAVPNPAAGSVSVLFSMPRAGRARVTVADVAGRRVRSLANRTFAAGAHDLKWDGRDDAGLVTPSGIYFVRINSGAAQRVTRVTRLW